MALVSIENLEAEPVERALGELQGLAERQESVELKIEIGASRDLVGGGVLANALMTSLGNLRLTISPPAGGEGFDGWVRTGLATALHSRPIKTKFEQTAIAISDARFGSTWTPAARGVGALFDEQRADHPPTLFQPSHAVFVNPDLTTPPGGPASITRLIRRWLRQIVLAEQEISRSEALIGDISFAIDQLVVNITEHARSAETPTANSFVQLEVVELEGGRVVQLTVLDTGAGIAATLRPKLAQAPASDLELLIDLLEGRLEGWGRGRGLGLCELAERVATRPGATLQLASGVERISVGGDHGALAGAHRVQGTVFSLAFPIPG